MTSLKGKLPSLSRRGQLGVGAAVLLAVGAAGGAGAVSMTRPAVEMAPTTPTAIGRLPASEGIVTVKGRVAEVYGDRFVVQDQTGRAMIDTGRRSVVQPGVGQTVTVQGRYDDGQLRASYLVGADGKIAAIGPGAGPRPGHGPREHDRPGRDGPPPPPPASGPDGAAAPPPPPPAPGCGVANAPPPPAGAVPPAAAAVPPAR